MRNEFATGNTPEGFTGYEFSRPVPHFQTYTIYILRNASEQIKDAIRGICCQGKDNEDTPERTITEHTSSSADGFYKWFDQYKKEHQDLSSDYNCLVLDHPLLLNCEIQKGPKCFTEVIDLDKGNILVYCQTNKNICFIANATLENLWPTLEAMINHNENIYKRCLLDLYENRLRYRLPEDAVLNHLWEKVSTSEIVKKYAPKDYIPIPGDDQEFILGKGFEDEMNSRFGIRRTDSRLVVKKKLLAKLDQLIIMAKKFPEANKELISILNDIPVTYIAETLKLIKPADLGRIVVRLDPSWLSQQSPLKIEFIEKDACEGIVKRQALKNDGKYILFLSRADKQVQVRFSNKYSFIVYLLYAIDRYKKGDNVEPLELEKLKDEYIRLYRLVYPHDYKYQTSFEQLVDSKNPSDSAKRTKLDNCLSEIRLNITEACEKLEEEYPSIHFIQNLDEHLYTKSANIHIPYALL